jgi:hypothetical protein
MIDHDDERYLRLMGYGDFVDRCHKLERLLELELHTAKEQIRQLVKERTALEAKVHSLTELEKQR